MFYLELDGPSGFQIVNYVMSIEDHGDLASALITVADQWSPAGSLPGVWRIWFHGAEVARLGPGEALEIL